MTPKVKAGVFELCLNCNIIKLLIKCYYYRDIENNIVPVLL